MSDFFELEKNKTTIANEILGGVTSFIAMFYVVAINPAILSTAGMPYKGVFVATALLAGVGSIVMALAANLPFGMAPGMSINSFLTYTVCVTLGYHWREALALTFLSGLVNMALMFSPLRKRLVASIPKSIRYGAAVGTGLLIAHIGLKSAGLVTYAFSSTANKIIPADAAASDSAAFPVLAARLGHGYLIAIFGLIVILFLLAQQFRTGDNYGAMLIGVIAATFVGIPLEMTRIRDMEITGIAVLGELGEVAFSFFGEIGLASAFGTPERAFTSLCLIGMMSLADSLSAMSSIISIGQIDRNPLFRDKDIREFSTSSGMATRLDRALMVNSAGGVAAALFGSSGATTYIESAAGISAGGRTGLAGLTIGVLFLASLPLTGFFSIIPAEAIAPSLIVVGCYFIVLVHRIDWTDFEEVIPASVTLLVIPFSMSIMEGLGTGIFAHVLLQIFLGKIRFIPRLMLVVSVLYAVMAVSKAFITAGIEM